MAALEELFRAAENMLARLIVVEGQTTTLTAQMAAAGVKFMEMDAEVNRMKGKLDSGGNKMKKIWESTAIQNLGTLSGPKEYRYWDQRLKNAMDQARP